MRLDTDFYEHPILLREHYARQNTVSCSITLL